MAGPLTRTVLLGGGVIFAGVGVSQFAASRPVGESIPIPVARAELRTQGAIGEAVKAGMSREDAQQKIKKVETHGGDKGLKYETDGRVAQP